jgi:mono/diheme cytochrome c family protein
LQAAEERTREDVRSRPGDPMQRSLRTLILCALAALPLAAAGAEAEPAARPPDPRRGEALYVGSAPLFAGGAPCLACHGIAGHGLARAASFGPDLSAAHAQYGADGLDAMLEDIVFPSMEPVYRGHAVTREERADLVAFLAESEGAAPARLGAGFGAWVAAAMGAFLVAVALVGKRSSGRRTRAAGRTP